MNTRVFTVVMLIMLSLNLILSLGLIRVYSATTGKEVWIFVDDADSLGDDGRILSSVVEYLTGTRLTLKRNNFPNSVGGYHNVTLVILRGGDGGIYDYNDMTSTQKTALKQYVQQGGNLYVEVYPDYVSTDWFGAELLANKRIVTSTCRYSFSGFLNGLFGNYSISPYYHLYGGHYYDDQRWGRVINGSKLPSTIQAVVRSDSDGIIYAGTYESGKLALVSGGAINYAICSGGFDAVYSPILFSVMKYLLAPAYQRTLTMEQEVAFRLDDVPWDGQKPQQIYNLLKSYGANKLCFAAIPCAEDSAQAWWPNWLTWFKARINEGSIFAMHGDGRGHYDYREATYDDFREGKQILEEAYNLTPTWFVTPENKPRSDTSDEYLRELGFTGVSSSFLTDEEYSNHLRPAGIYQIGSDGPPNNGGAGWIVNTPDATLMINSFVIGEPFTLMLHPDTDLQAIREFFALTETYYPQVRYVGMDDIYREAHLSLHSSPLWQGSQEDQFSYFNVDILNTSASVSLKPNKFLNGQPSNGTFYLKFEKTIQSAQINGTGWNAWDNSTLILPLLCTGNSYQLQIQFGTPSEPHILYKDYVITDYTDFENEKLSTRISGTQFYDGSVKVKTEGHGQPISVEVNGIPTPFNYNATNDIVSFSLNYLNSQIKNVEVRWPTVFTLNLSAGWNMVSFPVTPSDASFSSIFNGTGFYQLLTWSGTSYITPTSAEAGRGYWVLVLTPTTVNITGVPIESYELDLSAGWTMIGSIYDNIADASTVFGANYYQLLTWSGTSYVTVTTIEPGKGYWALVLQSSHIVVEKP